MRAKQRLSTNRIIPHAPAEKQAKKSESRRNASCYYQIWKYVPSYGIYAQNWTDFLPYAY